MSVHRSVYVAHGKGPYANARAALRPLDLSAVRGKRVLLKPNVGRVAGVGSGVVTHPEVVAAAIDAFGEAGAEVAIGESPIVGVDVRQAFQTAGIAAVADRRHCRLIDMDRRRFVEVAVPDGRVLGKLKVCRAVREFDFVVSIPVMKMHMHTGVTLSVKNMKGCLWRRSKIALHMLPPVEGSDEKPIDVAIAELASVLRPDWALIDGTVAMEGLGPSAGRARPLDVVLAGTDALAADAVACRLMGTRAERIAHLRLAAARGCGVIDLDRIRVTPDHWRDWIAPLAPPPENLSIEFPNVTVLDNRSCSACQSTVLLFLKRHQERIFDFFPDGHRIHIAIGRGHADVPPGTLCIGNCALGQQNVGAFVPGCPPVGSQILEAVAGSPTVADRAGKERREHEESTNTNRDQQ